MKIVTAEKGRVIVSFELVNEGDERVIPQLAHTTHPVDVFDKFDEEWIGRKMREKVEEHLRKYPTFKRANEYVDYVLGLPPKYQKWEVYQPISKWSKGQRKAESFRRLAEHGNG